MQSIEADFWPELTKIQAESMGRAPLEDGVYLFVSDTTVAEVLLVGIAREDMQAANLLWVY